ncbi:MAG: BatA domain-containing protein, partial [Thermoanaerobaculia bacterium]|nr:BatA domain-containing protein [Thermoanaerobaculia bacterium]
MFSLLTPVWLAAAAAVVVPLAIHLLSRGSARRIRVGSVRLVESRPTRRTRRLRFRRPWLFLLRAAILSLAALALAAPRAAVPAGGAPWVLVSPELMAQRERLEAANAELYAELDRLRGVAQLRLLAPGLPRRGGPGVAHEPWAMLLEADAAAPPSAVFDVFEPRRSALYPGERPRLAREVRGWAASDPAANRWIERALVSEAALG